MSSTHPAVLLKTTKVYSLDMEAHEPTKLSLPLDSPMECTTQHDRTENISPSIETQKPGKSFSHTTISGALDSGKSKEQRMAERTMEAQLKLSRGRLIKGFLEGTPKAEEMETLSIDLKKLETHEEIPGPKSRDILERIMRLVTLPRDEEFRFTERVTRMLERRESCNQPQLVIGRGWPEPRAAQEKGDTTHLDSNSNTGIHVTSSTEVTFRPELTTPSHPPLSPPGTPLTPILDQTASGTPPAVIDLTEESDTELSYVTDSSNLFPTLLARPIGRAQKASRAMEKALTAMAPSPHTIVRAKRTTKKRKFSNKLCFSQDNIWINDSRDRVSRLSVTANAELAAVNRKRTRLAKERSRMIRKFDRMLEDYDAEHDSIVRRTNELEEFRGLLLSWGAQDEEVGNSLMEL